MILENGNPAMPVVARTKNATAQMDSPIFETAPFPEVGGLDRIYLSGGETLHWMPLGATGPEAWRVATACCGRRLHLPGR